MDKGIRDFRGASINEYGHVYLKDIIEVNSDECVYMLLKTNCIEIRTKRQHDDLLAKLSTLVKTTNNDKYKRLYASVFTYSVALLFNSRGEISLGRDIVVNRCFNKRIIIEKCDNCIRLWHPSMFKNELNEYHSKIRR